MSYRISNSQQKKSPCGKDNNSLHDIKYKISDGPSLLHIEIFHGQAVARSYTVDLGTRLRRTKDYHYSDVDHLNSIKAIKECKAFFADLDFR